MSVEFYPEVKKTTMDYIVKGIRYVCENFKNRSPGSVTERETQEYFAKELAKWSDDVKTEEFELHPTSFMGFMPIAGLLVIVSIGGGAALTYASTAVFFPGAPAGPLIQATLVWGVLALLLIAATLLGSAVFSSGGAIGVGLGVLAGLGLISLLPAASNSPSGLLGLPGLLGSGQSADVVWPVVTGLGLTVFLLATAAIAFNRREL